MGGETKQGIECVTCREHAEATLTKRKRTCRVPSGWQQAGGVPKDQRVPIPGRCPKHVATGNKTPREATPDEVEPDWSNQCEICGAAPIVPLTGMCGPCTFGEADTAGGDW